MQGILIVKKLETLGACFAAKIWVGNRKNPSLSWRTCPRGDWMLWVAAKIGVDRKLLVLAACDCARLGLHHIPEGEERPRKCIEITEAWCRGEATVAQVLEARNEAWEVYYSLPYSSKRASTAAAAAAAGAVFAWSRAAVAGAAAGAGAVAQTEGKNPEAAQKRMNKRCAALVRKRIPWSVIAPLWRDAR